MTLFKSFCKARPINFLVYFLRAYTLKISETLVSFHRNYFGEEIPLFPFYR